MNAYEDLLLADVTCQANEFPLRRNYTMGWEVVFYNSVTKATSNYLRFS